MDLSKLPKFSQTKPGDAPQPVMDTSAPPPDPNRLAVPAYESPPPDRYETFERRTPAAARDQQLDHAGAGIDIWLSLIFGIIFLFMGLNFGRFLAASMAGHEFYEYLGPGTTLTWPEGTPKAGQKVAYQDWVSFYYNTPPTPALNMKGYWNDAAYFTFGAALLLEAVILFVVRTRAPFKVPLMALALLIAIGAVAFNLIVAIMWFQRGQMALMSLLAVAFGGWMVASEWSLLHVLLARDVAQKSAPNAGKTFGAQGG